MGNMGLQMAQISRRMGESRRTLQGIDELRLAVESEFHELMIRPGGHAVSPRGAGGCLGFVDNEAAMKYISHISIAVTSGSGGDNIRVNHASIALNIQIS